MSIYRETSSIRVGGNCSQRYVCSPSLSSDSQKDSVLLSNKLAVMACADEALSTACSVISAKSIIVTVLAGDATSLPERGERTADDDEEDDEDEDEEEEDATGAVDGPATGSNSAFLGVFSVQLPDMMLRNLVNIPHSLTNAWSSGLYL